MASKLLLLTINFVLFCLYSGVKPEIYTAVTELEALIDTHKKLAYSLEEFVLRERKRLDILKRYLERFKTEHGIAMRDIPEYLSNPINAFTLIKRLTVDLEFIEQKIREKTPFRKNRLVMYPKSEDVRGAALGLRSLMITYNLNITDMADGILKGNFSENKQQFQERGTPLVTSDCHEIGRAFYSVKDFKHGVLWMLEALKKFDADALPYPVTKQEIIELIAYGYFSIGDLTNAIAWTKKNLAILKSDSPLYTRAEATLVYYNNLLSKQHKITHEGDEDDLSHVSNNEVGEEFHKKFLKKQYTAACRGEFELANNITKRLKCAYLNKKHPFLMIAPMKMEVLHLNPRIVMLHDVVTDKEIRHIKRISKPTLESTTPQMQDTDEQTEEYEEPEIISKVAWYNESDTEVRPLLRRRIERFTGFDMTSVWPMQVLNYGVGGYYKPHYDFAKVKTSTSKQVKIIATVMFYLTDVSQGGATVFPDLGLGVFPRRGSALYWRNLLPSGEKNLMTKHAGCPVLHGSKWILTQWISLKGQELMSPCPKTRKVNQRKTKTIVITRTIP